MGFGGSVAAMIASIKANNAQRASRKSSYGDLKSFGSVSYGELIDHKKNESKRFCGLQSRPATEEKS